MAPATTSPVRDRAPTMGGRYPLVGHLPRMRRDPLGLLLHASRLGGVSRLDLGPRGKALLITHPDGVKHVLLDRMPNFSKQTRGFNTLRAFLGQGLLTSEGSFWRKQRRIAQPAFHHGRIQRFQAVMSRAADDLGDRWDSETRAGRALDVADDMMQVTLRIVGECLFSTDPSHESSVIGPPVDLLLRKFIARISAPIAIPLNWPTPGNREVRNAIAALRGVVDDIVARRRDPGASGAEHADLLQMLLEARDEDTGEGMSATQLRDEVLTLLVAGHETTAAALSWSWVLLAQHPDVDERLEAQLHALPDDPTTLAELEAAPLVGQVIHEAMRLYPPAWIFARSVVEDDAVCGVPVKAGSLVILSPYASHRRAAVFADPDRFDPDRFEPARASGYSKYEYFPFGAGPRICIGNGFALMEAQLVLARLRRRFRLRLAEGARPEPNPLLTLRVKDGLEMRAEKATEGRVRTSCARSL